MLLVLFFCRDFLIMLLKRMKYRFFSSDANNGRSIVVP